MWRWSRAPAMSDAVHIPATSAVITHRMARRRSGRGRQAMLRRSAVPRITPVRYPAAVTTPAMIPWMSHDRGSSDGVSDRQKKTAATMLPGASSRRAIRPRSRSGMRVPPKSPSDRTVLDRRLRGTGPGRRASGSPRWARDVPEGRSPAVPRPRRRSPAAVRHGLALAPVVAPAPEVGAERRLWLGVDAEPAAEEDQRPLLGDRFQLQHPADHHVVVPGGVHG